jgi:hypothetical protein
MPSLSREREAWKKKINKKMMLFFARIFSVAPGLLTGWSDAPS